MISILANTFIHFTIVIQLSPLPFLCLPNCTHWRTRTPAHINALIVINHLNLWVIHSEAPMDRADRNGLGGGGDWEMFRIARSSMCDARLMLCGGLNYFSVIASADSTTVVALYRDFTVVYISRVSPISATLWAHGLTLKLLLVSYSVSTCNVTL